MGPETPRGVLRLMAISSEWNLIVCGRLPEPSKIDEKPVFAGFSIYRNDIWRCFGLGFGENLRVLPKTRRVAAKTRRMTATTQ